MTFSLEFFPPRTPLAEERLQANLPALLALEPRFVSVSCGAAGSSQEGTFELVSALRTNHRLTCCPHMSSVGRTRTRIARVARAYAELGVRRCIALRGDKPEGYVSNEAHYTSSWELIAGLREIVPEFQIGVGCYPEGHPEDRSPDDRFTILKRKMEAGAHFAISQLFFDTDAFLAFRDECARRGITTPVWPGIMPIHNSARVFGFADKCGTVVPNALRARFEEKSDEETFEIARDIVCKQAVRLKAEGVEHMHLYTLNRGRLATEIVRTLKT